MGDIDTTSISQGGLKLYFNTDVLSDEALKARVASEVKSLGALVEPDFAKQVIEGKGLTFRRIYEYSFVTVCDVRIRVIYAATKRVEKITGYKATTNSSGDVKLVPETETYVSHDGGEEDYDYPERLKGVRCLLYPDSKFNKFVGLTLDEIEPIVNFCKRQPANYSQLAPQEYAALPDIESFRQNIDTAITSRRAFLLEENMAYKEVSSWINSQAHWSTNFVKFKNGTIINYHEDDKVTKVNVHGYYIYVSYKGQNYNIELDNRGKIVLEKSSFPIQRLFYENILSKKDIHQLFLNDLISRGDKVDSEYLKYVSNIENVEVKPVAWEASTVARTRFDLKAHSSDEGDKSKYLGLYFSDVYDFGHSIIPTNTIMEKIKKCSTQLCADYRYSNTSSTGHIPSKEVTEKDFPNEKEELACLYAPDSKSITYSIEKSSTPSKDTISFVGIKGYEITTSYENEVFTGKFDSAGSIQHDGIGSFKHSQKHIKENIDSVKRQLKSPAKRFVFPFATIVMILLSLWQAISLWGLNRYDFIRGGGQSIAMNIFAVASLIAMFISLCLLIGYIKRIGRARKLVKKYKSGTILGKSDCYQVEYLRYWLYSPAFFVWAIVGTVLFLVPFIIFLFV
ncbi:MAG: hypothetical protein IJ400_07150 [Clostridia bacterium]|nr:hypothetical protein [Clostridia bacterium]